MPIPATKNTKKRGSLTHIVKTEEEEAEFIKNSNWIEGEYSINAFHDAYAAWSFAKHHGGTINRKFIEDVHFMLMYRLNFKIAGRIRECQVYVGRHVPPPPGKILKLLTALLRKKPKTGEAIKKWHVEFERIHPFVDGNGRVGRIIYNLQRIQNGLPVHVIHVGDEQKQYYSWFSSEAKYLSVIELLYKYVETASRYPGS